MDVDPSHDSSTSALGIEIPTIEFQQNADENLTVQKKFINVLDSLDTHVEKLRKEALNLTEKRDVLLMSMDIIKHNELLKGLDEYELDEIHCYALRISNRLSTVEICVKTVRDAAQEEALHQVNSMIDSLITFNDRVFARQRCQTFLNACSQYDGDGPSDVEPIIDKKFEVAVLGCTLDDQKVIKKRLQALMTYLNKHTISG